MELSSNDLKVNLVINRLTKEIYNELCATPGALNRNEIFLVEDVDFDVYNKRVINVKNPLNKNDAVNLTYLETQYVSKNCIVESVQKESQYSYIIPKGLPNNSTYADKDGNCYKKNVLTSDTSTWQIVILSGESKFPDKSKLQVRWDSSFGWKFFYDNVEVGGRNTDQLADSTIYYNESDGIYLSASSWYKYDRYLKASEITNMLSNVNSSTTFDQFKEMLIGMKNSMERNNDVTSDIEYSPIENLFD